MVTKIVNDNDVGDLRNAADLFGIGDDRIVVVNDGSGIITMAGNDIIDVSQAQGAYFQVVIAGTGNDAVYGGGGTDYVQDGDGKDYVTLGGGFDFVLVGAGNDVLIGGAGTDHVDFSLNSYNGAGDATTNSSGVNFDLAKTAAQNLGVFGLDVIAGFENVTGGGGNDMLFGTTGSNWFYGGEGNDLVDGRGGNDEITGGNGNDRLIGRAGNDVLIGEPGGDTLIGGAGKDRMEGNEANRPDMSRDTFVYRAISDSGLTVSTRDDIHAFTRDSGATGDRIDLHLIDANPSRAGNQAFSFGSSFHSNKYGEVRVLTQGADALVLVDIDRDAAAEMTFLVHGVSTLSAGDFIL